MPQHTFSIRRRFQPVASGEECHLRNPNYFTEERLTHYITELDAAGFDFHIYTIGDRDIHEALNAIADMQVAGALTLPDQWYENAFLIGDRSSPLIPPKDRYEAEALVTLRSDWDVSMLKAMPEK